MSEIVIYQIADRQTRTVKESLTVATPKLTMGNIIGICSENPNSSAAIKISANRSAGKNSNLW